MEIDIGIRLRELNETFNSSQEQLWILGHLRKRTQDIEVYDERLQRTKYFPTVSAAIDTFASRIEQSVISA